MRIQYCTATVVVLFCAITTVQAQPRDGYSTMVRIYEDNDFLRLGDRTDQGYTNGTQLSVFYQKNRRSKFFLDRWMPHAGDSSINTFGWSVMQMMFTPKDLRRRVPNRNDYFYAAGLFAAHTLHASNPIKKYNIQTELMIGVMGPPALGKEAQTLMHRIIGEQKPMGWNSQLKTDILLNLNLTVEKELAAYNGMFEWIGGAEYLGGTALNGATIYSLIRVGKMTPYFNGFIAQHTTNRKEQRWQLYGIIRPSIEFTLTNALIEGGVFTDNNQYTALGVKRPGGPENNKVIGMLDYGAVLANGRLSISFTQRTMTAMLKGLKGQQLGNVSVYFAW